MKDHKLAINVGTIGHVDHGRATLSAALVRLLEQEGVKVVTTGAVKSPPIPIRCYDHHEIEPVIIERNNTPRGPRVKRGKGNKYR